MALAALAARAAEPKGGGRARCTPPADHQSLRQSEHSTLFIFFINHNEYLEENYGMIKMCEIRNSPSITIRIKQIKGPYL